jgi:3'-phosphoadenosine 5'-phosphosulfate sulfotransferase (PAPS reductase)/FAD synthetase
LYHRNGKAGPTECVLVDGKADAMRGSVALSARDVRRLLKAMDSYVLFSGGQDSLCLLAYLREVAGDAFARVTALHVDTTAGFPEVTGYVRSVCQALGVPLEIVRPDRDYFDLAKRWGIPGHNARWCCHELKVKPVRDFLARVDAPKAVYDGIRAAESTQRRSYVPVWHHPEFRCLSVSPIIHWSNDDVRAYVGELGLPPSPAAAMGCSAECWCGAYKKRADFEKLLDVHPDIFDKLVEVEEAQRGRYTFIYEQGNQVPLRTLRNGRRGLA